MALFKSRSGNDPVSQASPPADTIEVIRKKARQRLIGSAVLVLLAVVGFPLLFDSQPRPVPVDIAIEIPDKNKVKPLVLPGPAPVPAPASSTAIAPAAVTSAPVVAVQAAPVTPGAAPAKPAVMVTATASLNAKEELLPTKPTVPAKPPPVGKLAIEPPKVATPTAPKPDDGTRARALLEGKAVEAAPAPATSAAAGGRFVVQVGAFADALKAREVRLKLEKAGLKTYTQVVDSTEGKRTRVRVGPFDNKADANAASEKIKGLDLAASILIL